MKLSPVNPGAAKAALTTGAVIAMLGIGGSVWYQLQGLENSTLAVTASASGSEANNSPPLPPPPAPLIAPIPPAPAAEPASQPPSTPRSTPHVAKPDRIFRLTRTPEAVDANLLLAFNSLQGNDLDSARAHFEQARHTDPNNIHTLLALATIAEHQGRAAEAASLRQSALVAHPRDPDVLAAMLGHATSDKERNAAESQLKTLLNSHPESASLNFALANLYARQGRWPEAQQLYFNAVAAEGDNPDFLFNLAVSLDHLRQKHLAAQHYRLALANAEVYPSAFDPARARQRLNELGR